MAKCHLQRISGDNRMFVIDCVALQNGDYLDNIITKERTSGCTTSITYQFLSAKS